MEVSLLLFYYAIKRFFLFFDEWLFYFVLYKLYSKSYYKITLLVLIYGICCIYTSYTNIDRIENELVHVKQMIFLTDTPPMDFVIQFSNYAVNSIKYFF